MKLYAATIALALISLFPRHTSAQDKPATTPAIETIAQLQSAIEQVLAETNTPGVGIALVNKDGPYWVAGLGKAKLAEDIDADENTMFRIGSTSKMFVSLAVLKLQEQGLLSLDDKVRDLAPEIEFENQWESESPVRVAHLLEHTTGWDDIHLIEYAHSEPDPVTTKEGLDFHPHSRKSRWVPGTRMSYCNSGPPAAAYIVEKLTGKTFEEHVRETFFEPMGMETMTYFLDENYKKFGANLYEGTFVKDYWHIIMRSSGSINASANDMAKMVQFFLDRGTVNGEQIISPASLERMETPMTSPGAATGLEVGYGLSNYTSPYETFVYREHNGGVDGGACEFAYLPEYGLGHAIMTNAGGSGLNRISDLVRAFETRGMRDRPPSVVTNGARQESAVDGYYMQVNPRQQVMDFVMRILAVERIWSDDGYVYRTGILGGEPVKYVPVKPGQWRSVGTGLISMVSVTDPLAGEVLHVGNRTILVLRPVSAFVVYAQSIITVLWLLAMISAIPFAFVWVARRFRGGLEAGATIRVRVWPLLASLFFIGTIVLILAGIMSPFANLGSPTPVSIGIMVFSIAGAVAAMLSAYTVIKERGAVMNRLAYWHSAVLAGLHVIVTAYLLWHGVVGLRSWA